METSQKETYIHIPVSCSNITIARTKIEYPQEDSNLCLKFRKLLFYPLNYEGKWVAMFHNIATSI